MKVARGKNSDLRMKAGVQCELRKYGSSWRNGRICRWSREMFFSQKVSKQIRYMNFGNVVSIGCGMFDFYGELSIGISKAWN
jgi:hypothetical protein